MNTINRENLKAKLDQGDNFKLVMTLSEYDYRAMHIPGSLHFKSFHEAFTTLDIDDEIVLYCTGGLCQASHRAYHLLASRGYRNLAVYEGGVMEWEAAGYPLEGLRERE